MGAGAPPWGPSPHPGPAVHSEYGNTALHYAAKYNHRRIVRLLVGFHADVNAHNRYGCAVCACGESAGQCGQQAESAPRLPCRRTPLHLAADKGNTEAIAELLLRGADGAVRDVYG